ncbi:MAG: hypothetical protein KKH92_00325 [Firmicutes bacterium]|nr:hypothetical protein [Bacillota bacterium]
MNLKSSINIKYDFSDPLIIGDYYATTTHSNIITGILNGVLGYSTVRSHIAYGPYGSGKSYIASILIGMLSKSYTKSDIFQIGLKYEEVDNGIKKIVKKAAEHTKKYIPIILNGFEGDINNSIIKNLSKTLNENEINVIFPGYTLTINNVVDKWKKKYPETYTKFSALLFEQGTSIKEFKLNLLEKPEIEIERFRQIYRELTSGSNLDIDFNISLVEILESVCKQLDKKNMGIFLVYDEFGRYLQEIKDLEVNKLMQDMQNLAELANNGLNNLNMLFITHKPISYYFSSLDQANRSEFSKVEKRYKTYDIKSDYLTFLSILTGFMAEKLNQNINSINDDFISKSRKYNPFSGIVSDTELDNLIIKKLSPLHPITTFLLPKISSVFGQNERTMFSFLADKSKFGLSGFLEQNDSIYYPDYLIDYFFANIDESTLDDIKEYRVFNSNLSKLPTQTSKRYIEKAIRIYKMIILWKVTRGVGIIKITSGFLAFALGIDEKEIISILEELSKIKYTKYNEIEDQWEIFQGSSLNLDQEIQFLKSKIKTQNMDLENILNERNPYKYIYSQRHNNKYEITRFAKLDFYFTLKDMQNKSDLADQKILILFEEVKHVSEDTIYGMMKIDVSELKLILERYYYFNYMLQNNSYTLNYINLSVELEFELRQLENKLNEYYKKIFKKTLFYVNNEDRTFKNYKEMSNFLSDYFDYKYSKSIHIVNDQINMFKLTKIQSNSIKLVLEKVINDNTDDLENFFKGTQPADLVYFTIIKNLREINQNQHNIEALKSDLDGYLELNTQGNLSDVIAILTDEPYGIRPEVSILLGLYLIIDKWRDILLFSNGNFIPSINAGDLYDSLLNNPDKLKYIYSKFDFYNRNYLMDLEQLFVNQNSLVTNKSLSVRVCSAMHNWYITLPVITQQFEGLSLSEQAFLKIIASSRINPEQAIMGLISFSDDINEIISFKKSIETNFEKYRIKFERSIKNELGVHDELQWLSERTLIEKKSSQIVKIIENNLSFIDEICSEIDNIDITKWTKSSFSNLRNRIIEINDNYKEETDYNSIIVNGIERAVRDISLSKKARITYENIDNIIKATKKYMTDSEIDKIIFDLLEKYVR